MASSRQLILQLGPDGIAMEPPAIAYTEKALAEKELELKRYIEDNYSKIRNVERELASLTLEIKLTAGPKKAALEHFRKKIELSGEKIKAAKHREEQARKVWEAALRAVKEEEENKQRLCEDLNRLVQESAASQYSRLEELKRKLEALNPESGEGPTEETANGKEASATSHASGPKEESNSNNSTVASEKATKAPEAPPRGARQIEKENQKTSTKSAAMDEEKSSTTQQASPGDSRSRTSISRPATNARGRGTLVKGPLGQKPKANGWTGAGFDVEENAING